MRQAIASFAASFLVALTIAVPLEPAFAQTDTAAITSSDVAVSGTPPVNTDTSVPAPPPVGAESTPSSDSPAPAQSVSAGSTDAASTPATVGVDQQGTDPQPSDTSAQTNQADKANSPGQNNGTKASLSASPATQQSGANIEPVVYGSFNQDLVKIDKNTGALNTTYPITVPPGRNNLQPDLSLVYNSQDTIAGNIFGEGWSITIPYIERLNKSGVDQLYSTSSMNYFTSSLDGELATTTNSANYIARTDNGSFNKYTFSSNQWVMTDKNGVRYTFGSTTDSQQSDPNNSSNVYRWMLEKVTDTNSNYITYTYFNDAGQIYPSSILYTGNSSTTGIFEVDFQRTSSADNATSSLTGFAVHSNYRISEIDTKIGGTLVHKYVLVYTTGDNGATSLLSSVTETGFDSQGRAASLPPVAFSYRTQTAGWVSSSTWVSPLTLSTEVVPSGAMVVDTNGDNLPDVLYYDSAPNYSAPAAYINNAHGWTSNSPWIPPTALTNYSNNVVRMADVNGDGLPDLLYNDSSWGTSGAYINNGHGWTLNASWTPPIALSNEGAPSGATLVDVNGDGLPDIVYNDSGWGSGAYINNGHNWTLNASWTPPIAISTNGAPNNAVVIADVNGDGLPDILYSDSYYAGYGQSAAAYINNGHGWTLDPTWTSPVAFANENTPTGAMIADVNGDGLPDIISPGGTYINRGHGWILNAGWNPPLALSISGQAIGVRIADVNGDGLPDLLFSDSYYAGYSMPPVTYINNNGVRANLLVGITYPQGGSAAIKYVSAVQNLDGSGNVTNVVPYAVYVVSRITTNDGSGNLSAATYQYSGGSYYYTAPSDRQFAGFNLVTQTDAAGNVTKTYYHTSSGTDSANGEYNDNFWKIGKPYRVESYDGAGHLYKTTVNKWDSYALGGNAAFVTLSQTLDMDYDGSSTHNDEAESYSYDDATGNQTQMVQWGQVTGSNNGSFTDVGSDKYVTSYAYATGGASSVTGKKSDVTVTDQSGSKEKEAQYYYDNLPLGNIAQGNLTEEADWISGATYATKQYTYNSYGLVTQNLDANGHPTNYSYDPYNLHPATITNALQQLTRQQYDYSTGKITQTTDPNGNIFQTIYDGLGRTLQMLQPDQDAPSTLDVKAAFTYSDTSNAVSVQESDNLNATSSVNTYRYFDGLGRLIQTRKQASVAAVYKVSDRAYNNVNLLQKESLPYFGNGLAKVAPTSTAALFTTYTYDPLGRVLATANAVGTVSNAYAPWETTMTDALGTPKNEYVDAYGNLIQVSEHNGASTYVTTYTYDGLGDLLHIADANGNVRSFSYDGLGRRLTAQDLHTPGPATYGTWNFSYDNAGNLTTRIDPKNQTVNYVYDGLNRELTETVAGHSGADVVYVYDSCSNGVGRICSVTNASVAETYAYSPLGNVASDTKVIGGASFTSAYAHDWQGNTLTLTNPDNSVVQYTYDGGGLVSSIQEKEASSTVFNAVVSSIAYSPMDAVTTQVDANGASIQNIYDPAHLYRLISKITTSNGSGQMRALADGNTNIATKAGLPKGLLSGQPLEMSATPLYNDANLVSYLRFENNLTDAKGNRTFAGSSPSYSAGEFGNALSGGYANDTSAAVDWNSDATISFWFYLNSYTGSNQFVGRYNHGTGKWVYYFNVDGTNHYLNFLCVKNDYSSDNVQSANGAIALSTWYHVVGVRRSGVLYLYLNGTLVGTPAPVTNTYNTGDVDYIRTNAYSQSPLMDGRVDDLAYFNRALTATEISNLFTGNWPAPMELYATPLNGDANLVSYYRMEGNANDAKGSHSGTPLGVTFGATSGKFGQGAGFGGGTNEITLGGSIPLATTYALTSWFKTTMTGTGKLVFLDNSGNTSSLFMDISSGKLRADTWNGTTQYGSTSAGTYNDGAWHLAVAVLTTTTLSLYADGVLVFSVPSGNYNVGGANSGIGAHVQGAGDYFNGSIDDASIFSRALTATEIANLYAGSWPEPTLSLLGQYRTDGITPISEGSSTSQGAVVFGATLTSNTTSSVQLQVEVEPVGTSFANVQNITSSIFVTPSSTATTTFWGSVGSYHWQARAVDTNNNASAWHFFGSNATSADFVLGTVMTKTYTGALDSYTVPAGVTKIMVTAYGAQGSGSAGGRGGEVSGTFSVTPGTTYYVNVGGQNGYNGGGSGGGGGMTWFSPTSTFSLSNVLAIAAGGGGAGAGNTSGGAGGGATGAAGSPASTGPYVGMGGAGATQTSGGAQAGNSGYLAGCTYNPAPNYGGNAGQGGNAYVTIASGGGGGAGYYGGASGGGCTQNGASGGGGGGGSSYVSSALASSSMVAGVNLGNGSLVIIEQHVTPVISSLNQYRLDGVTPISEGSSTNEGGVVFSGALNSNATSGLQIQVEVEPAGISFTSIANATSAAFVAPGNTATTTFRGVNGGYHWQARAIDAQNNSSTWQFFGVSGSSTDFILNAPTLSFSFPVNGTTTATFPNWLMNAANINATSSYRVQVVWGIPDQTQEQNSINASGSALLAGFGVPKTLFSEDYTDRGALVNMVANATLYDNLNNVLATSTVSFTEQTISAFQTCGSTQIQCVSYTYDNNGNITQVVDDSATNAAKTVAYAYDPLNRLISASSTGALNGQNFLETFTYDPVGNILNKSDVGTYNYAGTNGANPDAVTSITNGTSTTAFTYDADGNLTNISNGFAFTWDYDNRLVRASSSNALLSYGYDSTGERVETINTSSTTYDPQTTYSTDGTTPTKQIFAEKTLVATIVGSGDSNAIYSVVTDRLGGASAVLDSTGADAELLDYYPYGQSRLDEQSGAFSERRKYIGQVYDDATQLSYLNSRYYDGNRGQFLSQDPVFLGDPKGQDVEDPQSLNSYSYAEGNPIAEADPTGKCIEDACIGEGIALTDILAPIIARQIIVGGAGGIVSQYLSNATGELGQGKGVGSLLPSSPTIQKTEQYGTSMLSGIGTSLAFSEAETVAQLARGGAALFGTTIVKNGLDSLASKMMPNATPIPFSTQGSVIQAGVNAAIGLATFGIIKQTPDVRGPDVSTYGNAFISGSHAIQSYLVEGINQGTSFAVNTLGIAVGQVTSNGCKK